MRQINVTEENIDQYIEEWHNSSTDLELHEYLGLTWEQYARWVEKGELPKKKLSREEVEEMMKKEQEDVYEYIKGKSLQELSEREIDVLVDRYVMNNRPSVNIHSKLPTSDWSPKNYSTNMSDAWLVAEKLGLSLIPQSSDKGFNWYVCDVEKVSYNGDAVTITPIEDTSYSKETAPMAICLSALFGVGIELIE